MTSKDELREKLIADMELLKTEDGNDAICQHSYLAPVADYILNLLEGEKREHYSTPFGRGTNSKCACGKEFATSQEINGHIQWQLATLNKEPNKGEDVDE